MIIDNKERLEYINLLSHQIKGIDEIFSINSYGIISSETEEKIKALRKKAEFLKNKLETNEFEIAIVGEEKKGKSTFANAMMGIDILPSKDARCTYTSTSILYGDNYAEVEFFTPEEFDVSFSDRLRLMGIEHADKLSFKTLSLEEYRRLFDALPPAISQFYGGTVNRDVENIIKYKDTISAHLGLPRRPFRDEEQLKSDDFKKYIDNPAYAIAVKAVTIRSKELGEDMHNAIIYDVPGFNSPTQIHKDQTIEKMKKADAIILVTLASDPSLTGPMLEIFRTEIDDDNIRFGEKLFVFANKADMVEDIDGNMKTLRDDLKECRIITNDAVLRSRVIPGSAKAKLEQEGKVNGTKSLDVLKEKGMSNGVDEMHTLLKQYNNEERFDVLKKRVRNIQNEIQKLFTEVFEKQNIRSYGASNTLLEAGSIAMRIKDEASARIRNSIDTYKADISKKYNSEPRPITEKLRTEVINTFTPEKYGVTDEELEAAVNSATDNNGNVIVTDVERELRKKMYNKLYKEYIDKIVELSIQEHTMCDEKLREIFMDGFSIGKSNVNYDEICSEIDKYISRSKGLSDNRGYYRSLIERFSMDLFELLLKNSLGDISRWNRFVDDKANFYSLSMYDPSCDVSVSVENQPMLFRMLLHDVNLSKMNSHIKTAIDIASAVVGMALPVDDNVSKLIFKLAQPMLDKTAEAVTEICSNISEKSGNKYDALSNRLENAIEKMEEQGVDFSAVKLDMDYYLSYFKDKADKSPEDVRVQIHDDIDILREVLNTTAVNAINIDKSFIALERQILDDLTVSLSQERFRDFISKNLDLLASEQYSDLREEEQKRRIHQDICNKIQEILNSMKNTKEPITV